MNGLGKSSRQRFSLRWLLISFVVVGLLLTALRHPRMWMCWGVFYLFVICQVASLTGSLAAKGRLRLLCAAFLASSLWWAPLGFRLNNDDGDKNVALFPQDLKGNYPAGFAWHFSEIVHRFAKLPLVVGSEIEFRGKGTNSLSVLEELASTKKSVPPVFSQNMELENLDRDKVYKGMVARIADGEVYVFILSFRGDDGARFEYGLYDSQAEFLADLDRMARDEPGRIEGFTRVPISLVKVISAQEYLVEKLCFALTAWMGAFLSALALYLVFARYVEDNREGAAPLPTAD